MSPEIFIKRTLKAQSVRPLKRIQTLWSGYGEIVRYEVTGANLQIPSRVILKYIRLDQIHEHPRGWQSDLSHQRKLRSYEVEANWYESWASQCQGAEKVADVYGVYRHNDVIYILMEDLDSSGYAERFSALTPSQCLVVLEWLANFHSRFLGVSSSSSQRPKEKRLLATKECQFDLWPRGTYWHLATRPDEWDVMEEGALKHSAKKLDAAITNARYQTLVHGDAKVANFCFSPDVSKVAAVDFQYVGVGIGVQDVAYFLGSCLNEEQLSEHLPYLLEHYFSELSRCLVARGESPDTAEKVAQEWDALFPVAWADFHRFIMGWCPEHAKNTQFSRELAQQGVASVSSYIS